MTLTIGDTAPDFTAQTTDGPIRFHDWIGNSWAVLFSHPRDFTPVCTTELGYMAKIKPEFDRRDVKIIGLSVDPLDNHEKWAQDIADTQGAAPNYPLIADTDFAVSKAYGMLCADPGGQRDPSQCFRDWSGQEDQARIGLPHDNGPQLRRGAAGNRLTTADGHPPPGHPGSMAPRRRR